MSDQTGTKKLSDLIDTLVEGTSGSKVSMRDLLETLDTRSYGPLLLLPALVAVSPIGAVPGISVLTASLIILASAQLLAGRAQPWLPAWILEFSFDRSRLESTHDKLRPWLKWVEKPVKPRLTVFIEPPFQQITAVCCILLALSFYPLALIPFAVALPAAAVCFFALALTARDGMLTVFALVFSVATICAVAKLSPS